MKRTLRERLVIALSTVAYVFDELAKIAAPAKPHVAFENLEEIDGKAGDTWAHHLD